MEARTARVEAEPVVQAARAAKKAHGAAHKDELRAEREARAGTQRRGAESDKERFDKQLLEGEAELGSDPATAPLVPIFRAMAPDLYARHVKGKRGKNATVLNAFAAWAEQNGEELQRLVAENGAVPSSQLQREQAAHYAAQPPPASAPGSGPRSSSRRGASSARGSNRSGKPSRRGAPSQRGGAQAAAPAG
jgi:hypothetical protein